MSTNRPTTNTLYHADITSTTRRTAAAVATLTQTELITSTLFVPEATPTTPLIVNTPNNSIPVYTADQTVWDQRLQEYLPIMLVFALIGLITALGSILYFFYRICKFVYHHHHRSSLQNNADDVETKKPADSPSAVAAAAAAANTTTTHLGRLLRQFNLSHPDIETRQREPIRYSHDIQPTGFLAKLLRSARSNAPPSTSLPVVDTGEVDNLEHPLSSTFVPIQPSPMTLVPRSEIWQDPERRRGVDEVALWERQQQKQRKPALWRFQEYPQSPPLPMENDRQYFTMDYPPDLGSPRSSSTIKDMTEPQFVYRSDSIPYDEPSSSTAYQAHYAYYNSNEYGGMTKGKAPLSDVDRVRQELEGSQLGNSSSQWLHFTGSRSL
ncbi:MAG: hypothetical protein EXX96DRAFT_547927 [Benjaminiella poitrasii]|nr:MAG: hypothetical protein EXX96DRAFT_547927 [Benjaminiella poitrasii]